MKFFPLLLKSRPPLIILFLLYQSERCDASSRRCEFSRSRGDLFCRPPLRSKASLSGSHPQDLKITKQILRIETIPSENIDQIS